MNLLRKIVLLLLLLSLSSIVYAGYDLDLGDFGTQATFNSFVEEVGGLSAYRAMAPAEPGGITGFDIAIAVSAVKIDSTLWDYVTVGSSYDSDYLYIPSLRVRKGLPFNIDVGASYTGLPDSDISLLGGEIQWALLEGSVATPALALRGHYSQLIGVDDLDLKAYGADLVVSKGFAMLTPYVGVGTVYAEGEYTGAFTQTVALDSHDYTSARYFGGVRIALALLQITADVEYVEQPVYSLKVGLGW